MATTIRDLAKRLNLSVSTVSYALNNGPRPVPAAVRDKVLKLAAELDYRPNRIARSMVTGRTFTLGIVPSDKFDNFIISPFILSCMNGIINTCERIGFDVLLFTRFGADDETGLKDSISDGRVDGLIFLAPLVESHLVDIAHRRKIPFVITHRQSDAGYASFTTDNFSTVKAALEHLTSLGHRKIGHIYGSLHLEDGIRRKAAFERLVTTFGLENRPEWNGAGDFTRVGGYTSGISILSQPNRPTAIYCSNDEMAIGLYRAAEELGIQIPTDLSVVGTDDAAWAPLLSPPLTTIHQSIYEMAVAAVEELARSITSGEPPRGQQFGTGLIVRASSCSPKETS